MSQRVIQIKWSAFIPYTSKNTANIPSKGGVYEYYSSVKGKKKKKYVGQTDDLSTRFKQHLGKDEKNKCLKKLLKDDDYIWYYRYALISNDDDRKDAELGLYNKYSYECNEIEPSGSGKGNFRIVEI